VLNTQNIRRGCAWQLSAMDIWQVTHTIISQSSSFMSVTMNGIQGMRDACIMTNAMSIGLYTPIWRATDEQRPKYS